jgi:hypothetical protein
MAAKKKNNAANTTEPDKTVINVVEKFVKLTVKLTVENFEKVDGVSLEQVVYAVYVADYKLKFCENVISFNKYNFEAIIEANIFCTQELQNLSQILMPSSQTS